MFVNTVWVTVNAITLETRAFKDQKSCKRYLKSIKTVDQRIDELNDGREMELVVTSTADSLRVVVVKACSLKVESI